MNNKELDAKLRQLNNIEKKLKEADQVKLKKHFSNKAQKDHWVINSAKLMKSSEDIAIHKHDRFIDFEKHKHDYIEMVFVYSGSINHEIEGKKINLKKGEIILLDMNVEHSIEAASESDIAINILFKKEFFDWYFVKQISYNDLISNFVVKAIYDKSKIKQYIYFKTSENDQVWHLMLQVLNEYYEERNGMATAIKAYMLLLFNELFRDYQKYLSKQIIHKIDTSIVVEILDYIDENYKTVTLKDMAKFFNYSPDYLGKQIKKLTGHTLRDLIRDKKLERAEYLIQKTELSVIDIVAEVGYSNVTYFYKQFKSRYGVTPDELRKKM
ncbi:MAG: AraC family transcriptional regulator [Eubacteriales bacterium]